MCTIRRVSILGGNRISFTRSNTAYAKASNQEMLTATLQGLVDRFNLHGERLGDVAAGAVMKHLRDLNLVRECVLSTTLSSQNPAFDLQQACGTGLEATMLVALDYPAHYRALPNAGEATPEMVDAILDGAATLCEEVLAPLNSSGDEEGCHFKDGVVTTPAGFRAAYEEFVAGGWQGLSFPEEFGGQDLPMSLSVFKSEMMGTANWSFSMYPGLSVGRINTLMQYASDELKAAYLPRLVSGEWTSTMCLTEPQCGSDLAQVKTRAEPQADGSYLLSGSKIFISAGEHDLAENIIHIVLARLPDAPAGTRGISLFVVPKYVLNDDLSLGSRNPVTCGSIEHKMGIRASATATLNFDGATGYLLGVLNKGLAAMFTFNEYRTHWHRDSGCVSCRIVLSGCFALRPGAPLDACAVWQKGAGAGGRYADLASGCTADVVDPEGHRGRRPGNDLQHRTVSQQVVQRSARRERTRVRAIRQSTGFLHPNP